MKSRIQRANRKVATALFTVMTAGALGGLVLGATWSAALSAPVWLPVVYVRAAFTEEENRPEEHYPRWQ